MSVAEDILKVVNVTAAEVRNIKAAEEGRYADYVRRFDAILAKLDAASATELQEAREQTVALLKSIHDGFEQADTEDDAEGVLEGQRWAQTQDAVVEILAKLDAVVVNTTPKV